MLNWTWARRLLAAGGILYAWSLIPTGVKPTFVHSPIHKSSQTITVDVTDLRGTLANPITGQLKTACSAPYMLRPFEGGADHVNVKERYLGQIIAVHTIGCAHYTINP